MAEAVGQSNALRILLPVNLCNNYIAGVEKRTTVEMIDDCIAKIRSLVER